MTYEDTIEYLYAQLPQFQRIGASAYKPGLERVLKLSALVGDPHKQFKSIHIAGTNGKGSTASTIAAVLQSAGYKVGLYTSPHLVDFRERIRIDGEMITREAVVEFVERWLGFNADIEPSFFELTMVMAFDYFAHQGVDVAVVEVGMGGRLDSTNIITPVLSVITNISKDHTQFLGNTLPLIAAEKSGIIKPEVPVVIGEAEGEVRRVFVGAARMAQAPIRFAQDSMWYTDAIHASDGITYLNTQWGDVKCELTGDYQCRNAATTLAALDVLNHLGWKVNRRAVVNGFAKVCRLTGFMGRWSVIGKNPLTIVDTGHNVGGWEYLGPQLMSYGPRLRMVIGFVADKDVDAILSMMPPHATYYFTQASIPRAMDANELARKGADHGLKGCVIGDVRQAVAMARNEAAPNDTVFVGGSTYVVGEAIG